MGRQGKRVRIAEGIYSDATGIGVTAKMGSGKTARQTERRFPLRTSIKILKKEREKLRTQLSLRAPLPSSPGTLAADVEAYLKTVPAESRANAKMLLGHWLEAGFRNRSRHTITPLDVQQQLTAWLDAGKASSTVNHRRTALMSLYRVLDGQAARNPVREVPRLQWRGDEPRGIPPEIVSLILAQLPDRGRPTGKGKGTRPKVSLTKARLLVMATTGLPQAQIMRLVPHDLDLIARTLYVRPRRKGQGTRGKTLPLTHEAVAAFEAFEKANAWGPFSTRSMAYSFKRAMNAARKQWRTTHQMKPFPAPENLRSYDLRHSFLTEAYRRTGDLRAVAELAMHSDVRTTQRYAEAAVSDRALRAIEAIDQQADAKKKA